VRTCAVGIFRFRHLWHVPADLATTFAALADVDHYPLWWPQIRGIRRIDGDSGHAYVRSMLPYTLDLLLTREIEDAAAGVLRVQLGGDLEGWSEFRLSEAPGADEAADEAAGAGRRSPGTASGRAGTPTRTVADYRQVVTVTATGLQHFLPVATPLLTLNHTWMMRSGERGLAKWLADGGGIR